MKTILSASLFAASLAYGQLPELAKASAEGLPPKSAASICIKPTVPESVAKKWRDVQFPLGGLDAPIVSCHDNKEKFKVGYHFKLFVGPGTDFPDAVCRIDYLHKPEELQNACWNACIEQKKLCDKSFTAKNKADSKTLCDAQLLACKNVNDRSRFPIVINDLNDKLCKNPG
ncbi:hypothetical protein [Vitiosangium sp. GDMCC 1.1324]|uniref:hypothetical protein n=1 Tax=Vitiosangium sp. (strain GDMCC 1.1324) TaxID=2138576 RepID=UPI000D364C90|nr:hypothetical protein [Vitiosangium sp. GDMCC 1.1324]PTL76554.1 hypothetical protein DAT35_48955 [Vitiosangium sp. GDMCC 1.1324]